MKLSRLTSGCASEFIRRTIAKLAAIRRTGAKKVRTVAPSIKTAKTAGIDSAMATTVTNGRLLAALMTSMDMFYAWCIDASKFASLAERASL